MRKYLINILLLSFALNAFSTNQQNDKLIYNGLNLSLLTGWGHPSPLQTYFCQNKIKNPFKPISTANYRGHIATWKIDKGKLYLIQIEINHSKFKPNKFGIKSKSESKNNKNIFADWFSGIIECIYFKYPYDYETLTTYYFHIKKGVVIEMETKDNNEPNKQSKLSLMNTNYITFYYRLRADNIIFNNKESILNTNYQRLSPIFLNYGEDFTQWPYNWENQEKSGAPHCTWIIIENKLYLSSLELYYGLKFDTIYKDTINIQKEFSDKIKNNKVFASWVTGIYLITHGKINNEKLSPFYNQFEPNGYTFIRVINGEIVEIFNTDSDYDPDYYDLNDKDDVEELKEDTKNMDPKLKKLVMEYYDNSKIFK